MLDSFCETNIMIIRQFFYIFVLEIKIYYHEYRFSTALSINLIHDCYRIIFQSGLNTTHALEKLESDIPQCPERDEIINFIKRSKHGIIKGMN